MKIARNNEGKFVKILNSNKNDSFYCICCGNELQRIFTPMRQYFKHPVGIGDDCEKKIKNLNLDSDIELSESDLEILENNLYNKEFTGMETIMSDYISEEGYSMTEEQKSIIFSTEDKIKIEATAGSSKSTTLYYYAKERPFKKILYLVYNSSMKKEAENSFGKLKNVTIKTLHGLAYGTFGFKYRHKLVQGNYSARDVMTDLRITDIELAVKVKEWFNLYLLSDLKSTNELYKEFSDDEQATEILNNINLLFQLKLDTNNNVKVEHDFYLKLYHLDKPNLSKHYDIILLDEAQDSNLLTYDVIINSKCNGIVMVGDSRQTLYKWRLASNIMDGFEATEYKLSTSFRISNNVAHLCNLIINQIGCDDKFKILGFNNKNKFVNEVDENEPFTILCRTNSSILERAFSYVEEDKKIYFVGGYNGYKFENLMDMFNFKNGRRVNNHMFNKYDTYSQMIDIAEKSNDIEILILKNLIEKYGSDIPKLINKVSKNKVDRESDSDVTMSTVHKSKGLTIKRNLVIHGDHLDLQDLFEKLYISSDKIDISKSLEEIFIIYVAITRGCGNIKISDTLCKYFITQFKMLNNKESNIEK